MARIAFIGLGNMGSGMCANLCKAGHEVRAFDLNTEAVQAAVDKGAVGATSLKDAVQGACSTRSPPPASATTRPPTTTTCGRPGPP